MSVLKNVLKNFQMSEHCGCLDKMSKVNFSPAETLLHGRRQKDSFLLQDQNELEMMRLQLKGSEEARTLCR